MNNHQVLNKIITLAAITERCEGQLTIFLETFVLKIFVFLLFLQLILWLLLWPRRPNDKLKVRRKLFSKLLLAGWIGCSRIASLAFRGLLH